MSVSSHFDDDVRYTVQVNRFLLRLIGVWPIPSGSRADRALKAVSIAFCLFAFLFFLLSSGLHTVLKLQTFRARLKTFGALCFYLTAAVTYCLLLVRKDQLRMCISRLEDDWKSVTDSEDRAVMLDRARAGRYIAIWTMVFFYSCNLTNRVLLPLSRGKIVVNGNTTLRPLVHSVYFVLFDPQRSPAYEIVFLLQCVCSVVMYNTMIGVCGLSALFVMHACGQLEILSKRMIRFAGNLESSCDRNLHRKLASIVDRHVRVYSFLNRVERTLRQIYLVEIVGCTFITCLLGYYIITEWESNDGFAFLPYGLMLTSFTVNIFILCYIGEVLSTQAQKFNVTSCTSDWYFLPNERARSLILVMAMCNYPLKLTAGKFIDLSMNSFGAVGRTAIAYLNILRTVTA